MAAAEAQAMFADVHQPRDAGEALAAAAVNADQVLRSLQQRVELSGELRAHDLEALRTWMELVSRLSKAVLDAKVDERRVRLSEQTAADFVMVMKAVLVALGHNPQDPAVLRVVSTELRALDARAAA